jgi:hypothetical protein
MAATIQQSARRTKTATTRNQGGGTSRPGSNQKLDRSDAKKTTRQNTKLESEGAEFLVLGQLLIEGIPAYKTYTNLRGYDLVATWPETKRVARIQVKSRWATTAPHFLIKNVDECDFVVLVRLNRGTPNWSTAKRALLPEDPEYCVLAANEAKNRITQPGTGWGWIWWRKDDFEPHRRNWSIVRKFLRIPKRPKLPKAGIR